MAGLGGLIGGWRNICNSLPVSDDGPEFLTGAEIASQEFHRALGGQVGEWVEEDTNGT